MYDFRYSFLKEKYGTKATLLFTNTQTLSYVVETDDLCEDISSSLDFFDTSNYPPDHRCFSTQNKKVLGKMKNERGGRTIREFVGLRAKM